jgi:ribosomal protein S18 acetylase RimI-like enzyme
VSETTANLAIRPRLASDDDFVLRLSDRLFAPYSRRPRATVASMLVEPGAITMIAESGAELPAAGVDRLAAERTERRAGFFVLTVKRLGKPFGPWDDPATSHLDAIGVRADLRGRGVGRFLLANALAAARARGAVSMGLMTADTNLRALQLFAAAGFAHVLALDEAYARGQRGIFMLKPL